jgi:hypothetical protein
VREDQVKASEKEIFLFVDANHGIRFMSETDIHQTLSERIHKKVLMGILGRKRKELVIVTTPA